MRDPFVCSSVTIQAYETTVLSINYTNSGLIIGHVSGHFTNTMYRTLNTSLLEDTHNVRDFFLTVNDTDPHEVNVYIDNTYHFMVPFRFYFNSSATPDVTLNFVDTGILRHQLALNLDQTTKFVSVYYDPEQQLGSAF